MTREEKIRHSIAHELRQAHRNILRAYEMAMQLQESEIMQWLEVTDTTLVKAIKLTEGN